MKIIKKIILCALTCASLQNCYAMDVVKKIANNIIQNPSVRIVGGSVLALAAVSFLVNTGFRKLNSMPINNKFIKKCLIVTAIEAIPVVTLVPAMQLGSWPKLELADLLKPSLYALGVSGMISLLVGADAYYKNLMQAEITNDTQATFNISMMGAPLALSLFMLGKRYYLATK